ncbi:MAG: glycerophosphodiester phosphodiesterase [Bacillati bacterium ANGP1]|uniref:Glycerophosphodiester phosphodiesterase n=1 Tax=Candidatus Segetimicrobium genomatis TaxID=2569760 RepID=A0A537KZ22_9BACT|nr:MAG: glycerophosphodiester phosphodiesterase [Terrabacteria group bacterium ANGP1]
MNKWLESDRCLVIAHRGASAAAPENTLAAFRLAADLGADAVELDVRRTVDGQLVVIHDASVDRTTDGTGRVAALTLDQLRRFDAGRKFGPPFRGERIPLLSKVFEALGGRLLVDVEVKAAGVEAALLDLIKKMQMVDSVLISSFDAQVVAHVRDLAPEMPAGLLQSAADPYAAVSVRATAYLPEVTALTADVVASCRSHGLRVITWTVRTEEEARQALRVGVDGIIADDPTLIRKMLARLKTSP